MKAIRLFHADDRQWLQILTRLWYFTLHFRMTSQVRASITFYVEYRKSDICSSRGVILVVVVVIA